MGPGPPQRARCWSYRTPRVQSSNLGAGGPALSSIISLERRFASRYGVPILAAVDAAIFTARYFTDCLACTFCGDQCCTHGVDVDRYHYERIVAHADALERFTGISRDRWFETEVEDDPEVPGGATYRTRVEDGTCVFHNRNGRGCRLQTFCATQGIDHHELKSMVDCLFPLTFADGVLRPADDAADGSLVCLERGPTLYRGQREELRYYFGDALVAALDPLERQRATAGSAR